MTEDVATTKRKPLTPKQRLKLFEAHKGICCQCGKKITETTWIDEHVRPLALGGSNDLANRAPAHKKCAEAKTNGPAGDLARAAKAKRQKRAAVIGKDPDRKKIEGASFTPAAKQLKASKPIEKLAALPRRAMFK